ncbi:Blp family class II bacteriocin [Pseudolactococcus yaeyamensis]
MPMNYVEMTDDEMMYVDGGTYWTAWSYTGVAVGVNLLGYLIDAAGGYAAGALAGALGITVNAAGKLLGGYASNKVGLGSSVARALDKNGNGWVGLDRRDVFTGLSGGVPYGWIGADFRTG